MPVRIVDIDDESLARLGQWPWPRTHLARIISLLSEAGAASIAFDMGFAEGDRNSIEQLLAALPPSALREQLLQEMSSRESNDAIMAGEIAKAQVVLGAILINQETEARFPVKFGFSETGDAALPFLFPYGGSVTPLAELAESARGVGALNWVPDRDQIIRSVPLLFQVDGRAVPSLAAEALRVAQGAPGYIVRSSNASGQTSFGTRSGVNAVRVGQVDVRTGPATDVRLRFSHTDPRRFLSAWRIMAGEIPPEEIHGRIILVGTSAAGLRDQRATPIDASVPGVEVHAQIMENMLDGQVLTRPDWAPGLELLAGVLLGVLIAALLPSVSPLWGAIAGGLAAAALIGGSFHLFASHGILTDAIIPSLTGGLVYLAGVWYLWREEKAQRRYVRQAFGKYVSPAVVEQLVNDPQKLAIGGQTRVLTVMFVDLRSFTTISEGMDAPEVTKFMNEYLTPMTDIIIEENGTVDKYMGDAIMAFWNAPLDDNNHAANAVRGALRMRAALQELNAAWQKADVAAGRRPKLVKFGIGLNTGSCSVGNMGSLRRFDYSAMGDSVNLASRLEGASKQYGLDILVNESTKLAAPDFLWIEVDRLRVKGKKVPTTVFALAGEKSLAADPAINVWLERHARFLAAYRARNFELAVTEVTQLVDQAPADMKLMYTRLGENIVRLNQDPPPVDWDGARNLDDK